MIKKGKMTKEEIKQRLKETFKDFKFYEDGHYYECKGKRVGVSVTTFIHEYCNEFDEIEQAKRTLQKNIKNYNYARQQLHIYYGDIEKDNLMREYLKLPLTIEDILKEWHYKRDFSCEKGTTCHELVQSLWSGEKWKLLPFDGSTEYLQAVNKIQKQANQFRIDYNDILENLIVELPIGSEEYDIASCVDHLFYNKFTGGLVLVDYKTNTDIYKDKKYYENSRKKPSKMKIPLQHLEDLTITHYYIQLSIYKFLIEKYTGLKVDEMFIVYMSENIENYEIIEIPYLKKEVKEILELRRINKMGKMLLIMGEQGSGKSFSLKNLPPKEHFYIDCDKKGMNYKGWRNDYSEEQKNYIKCNDGETIVNLLKNISEKAKHIKYVSIDTINSIMIADELKRSKQKGYDKWDDMANIILQIIMVVPDLRDDLTVIFIGHTQTSDDGFTQLKTNGRKLNKIGVEGYFNTVLLAKCVNAENNEYVFETKANNSTARTPYEAFDTMTIPNDIVKVIEVIREY